MSEKPTIYKTREYKEIVTVIKSGGSTGKIEYTVDYNENALEKDIKNLDEKDAFNKLVGDAVSNLRETLNNYTKQPLLQDLYSYPEKFQKLAKKLKTKLNEITNENKTEKIGKNQVKAAVELTKQLGEVVSYRNQSKKLASENFGIMTAKTINNAIASWIKLKTYSKPSKISYTISSNEKEKPAYWEEKLEKLRDFKPKPKTTAINEVNDIVESEMENLKNAIGDVSKIGARKGIKNFIKAIKNARKAMKIDTEECTEYHQLGMLKLCCELMEKLKEENILKALPKTGSMRRRVAMKMYIPSDKAASAGNAMILAATVIGLYGSLSVVMLLPSLLVSGLLGLMGLTTRLGAKIALKVGHRMHERGKSGGENMLGTSSKGKRKDKTKSKKK